MEGNPMLDLDDQVNAVTLPRPRSVIRIVTTVWWIATLVAVALGAWRIVSVHIKSTTEALTIDPLAVPRLQAEVAAVDSEIAAAQDALTRFDAQTKRHWISRESDRLEFNRLNQEILDLHRKRAHLGVDLMHAINRVELSRKLAAEPEVEKPRTSRLNSPMFDEFTVRFTDADERRLANSVLGPLPEPQKHTGGHWRIVGIDDAPPSKK